MTSQQRSLTTRDSVIQNGLYEEAPSDPLLSAALGIAAVLLPSMPQRWIANRKTGWRSRTITTRRESARSFWTAARTSCTTSETFPTCTSWKRRRRCRPVVSWCRSSPRFTEPTVGEVPSRWSSRACRTWGELERTLFRLEIKPELIRRWRRRKRRRRRRWTWRRWRRRKCKRLRGRKKHILALKMNVWLSLWWTSPAHRNLDVSSSDSREFCKRTRTTKRSYSTRCLLRIVKVLNRSWWCFLQLGVPTSSNLLPQVFLCVKFFFQLKSSPVLEFNPPPLQCPLHKHPLDIQSKQKPNSQNCTRQHLTTLSIVRVAKVSDSSKYKKS